MEVGIRYYYAKMGLHGERCPACGKTAWNIFKCDTCGNVFCSKCRPDLVSEDLEEETITVICDCGCQALFV